MFIYNVGIHLFALLMRVAALFNTKAKLWVDGRRGIFKHIAQSINTGDRIVWIHAASLGEFEQGRPVIERIKRDYPERKILLTFFSPSGYEVRKGYEGVDYIFYLPADTLSNAKRFVGLVRPEVAIIIKYEFWLNILSQLHRVRCKTYLISAIFREDQIFFKKYGEIFREALRGFKVIFVQNDQSKELLSSIGIDQVVVAGDTRFDRVASIANSSPNNDIVERFQNGSKVFIAGSTWGLDEEVIKPMIEKYTDLKFIIAPHEMVQDRIDALISGSSRRGIRYTECISGGVNLAEYDVLIIDTIGILSSVYRYARYAYIGGGFGVGIHNTLEAATFGLPLIFGPNYLKFKEARDMIASGAATTITSSDGLDVWLSDMEERGELYEERHLLAQSYVQDNIGATDLIIKKIF